MGMWTDYSQRTPMGTAGSLYDLTGHAVDSFRNEEADGILRFGVGVVRGTDPGESIKLPVAASTADKFVGVVMNGGTHEMDMANKSIIRSNYTTSIMRHGRVWVRLATDEEPHAGDPVFMVIKDESEDSEVGHFKAVADGANTIQVNARFLTDGSAGLAAIELYNQMAAAPTT